jgi:hypothetical protein
MSPADPMPTLCAACGPVPERLRPFVVDGELRAGDATGLEAAWILSGATLPGEYYPEMDWTRGEIEADALGTGCVRCGDEEAATEHGLCWWCQE